MNVGLFCCWFFSPFFFFFFDSFDADLSSLLEWFYDSDTDWGVLLPFWHQLSVPPPPTPHSPPMFWHCMSVHPVVLLLFWQWLSIPPGVFIGLGQRLSFDEYSYGSDTSIPLGDSLGLWVTLTDYPSWNVALSPTQSAPPAMFLGSDICCVSLQVQECCYWPDTGWPSLQGSYSWSDNYLSPSSADRGLPPTDYPSSCVAMFLALSVPQECFYASDTTQECCFWHWLPPPPPPPQVLLQFWHYPPRSIVTVLTMSIPQEYWYGSDTVMSVATVLTQYTPPHPPPECCYGSNTVYPLPWVLLHF